MLRLRRIPSISLACVVLALGSCGGDDSSPGPGPAAITFSGTAAVGLPLVGTVTVKDSSSPALFKAVPIGANGSYSVDVAGMKAPLVMRAEGNVGATSYVVHSATAEIGAGGTLNITPLTDLIIANAAGKIAANYFDSGNFAGLTKADLDAESAALKAKLLPVLQAMQVDASIDLLRTPFTPLASALDAALDIIRISVNPDTNVATITNLVNQISITDSITAPAATEGTTPPLSADGTAAAADDLPKIRKLITDFIDLYKTSLPQPASIRALLSDSFLHDDTGPTDFSNDLANSSEFVGGSFTNIVIDQIDYDYPNGPLAVVSFTILDKNGRLIDDARGFPMIRGGNGVWRLYGSQRTLEIDEGVHLVNDIRTGCRASGLEFGIEDNDSSNSANIAYVLITGPGLPIVQGQGLPPGIGRLRYNRNLEGGDWQLVNPTGNPYWYPMTGGCNHSWGDAGLSDTAIAAIPDNALYTVRAFTSGNVDVPLGLYGSEVGLPGPYGAAPGQSVGRNGVWLTIPKRPLTLAELNASTQFPGYTSSPAFATYSGGPITINGTGGNPRGADIYLGLADGNGLWTSIDEEMFPAANGTFSATFSLPNPGTITARELRLSTQDIYDRGFMSVDYIGAP